MLFPLLGASVVGGVGVGATGTSGVGGVGVGASGVGGGGVSVLIGSPVLTSMSSVT